MNIIYNMGLLEGGQVECGFKHRFSVYPGPNPTSHFCFTL